MRLRLTILLALPIFISATSAVNIKYATADEDRKTLPGAMCQPRSNTDAVFRDSRGTMQNVSAQTEQWECPIVRDFVTGFSQIILAKMFVFVPTATAKKLKSMRSIDKSSPLFPSLPDCSIVSRTQMGDLVASRDAEFPRLIFANGVIELDYAINSPNIPAAEEGYYYFDCNIPQDTGVITYEVNEGS